MKKPFRKRRRLFTKGELEAACLTAELIEHGRYEKMHKAIRRIARRRPNYIV